MAVETSFRDIQIAANDIRIRKIGVSDLFTSLREGYSDFNATPSFGFFLTIIYPVFALVLTALLVGEDQLYLAFPLIAGFTLLGPVASVALCEMSRRRERGLDTHWSSAFSFVHSASFAPIAALSIMLVLLYVAWLYMAEMIYFGLFGDVPPASVADFMNELVTTRRGAALIMYGNAIGFAFAFTVLAISAVAFPLLLDRPATSLTAISVSIRAVAANLPVMAVWGIMIVALLAAGSIVFLIGLAVILPILGHATWHLYRKVVEP